MDKITAKKQINKLLLLDSTSGVMIAGASWVALLAARGFSTIEIGLLESIFHIASMTFEIPSGVVADVFGRKRVMVMSQVMTVISALLMILSGSFFTIAVAMVFSALSYNLASGTREALAYDSLKSAGNEDEYNKFASNDLVIYELASSTATLLAGVALLLGYQKAYAIDIVGGTAAFLIAMSLLEVETEVTKEEKIAKRFKEVIIESIYFLRDNRRSRRMIIFNAALGAIDVLVVFFAQALLPEFGIEKFWLGPALFALNLGGAAGAKVVEKVPPMSYRKVGCISCLGVALAVLSVFTGNFWCVIIGGFIGSFSDSFIEVRTDVELNNQITSEQRATLMSVNSFTYSVVMIVLSPIFGWIFA